MEQEQLCRACLSTVGLKSSVREVSTLNLSTKLATILSLCCDVEIQTSNENKN